MKLCKWIQVGEEAKTYQSSILVHAKSSYAHSYILQIYKKNKKWILLLSGEAVGFTTAGPWDTLEQGRAHITSVSRDAGYCIIQDRYLNLL